MTPEQRAKDFYSLPPAARTLAALARVIRQAERDSRSSAGIEEAVPCTLCSAEPSSGFYTGCMVKDGHAPEWLCDGKGNLRRRTLDPAQPSL